MFLLKKFYVMHELVDPDPPVFFGLPDPDLNPTCIRIYFYFIYLFKFFIFLSNISIFFFSFQIKVRYGSGFFFSLAGSGGKYSGSSPLGKLHNSGL